MITCSGQLKSTLIVYASMYLPEGKRDRGERKRERTVCSERVGKADAFTDNTNIKGVGTSTADIASERNTKIVGWAFG